MFQESVVAKGLLCSTSKTGTVTWEQLVAMFFPLMSFNLSHYRTVYCFSN